MRFGVNTWLWVWTFTTDDIGLVKKIADFGFDWIEIPITVLAQFDYEKAGTEIQDYGLGVSVCAPMGPKWDLTIDDVAVNREGIHYLKHCVDAVVAMGGSVIGGPVYASVGRLWMSEGAQRRRDLEHAAHNLRKVGNYAADKGVIIGVEALNRWETSFINTAEQALELVEMVNNPSVQLMADTFHMNIEEKNLPVAIELMGSHLVHVHANENDRGTPGSGHVDWTGVAEALRLIEYTGALVIESFSTQIRDLAQAALIWHPVAPSDDELAREGLRFLRQLLGNSADTSS